MRRAHEVNLLTPVVQRGEMVGCRRYLSLNSSHMSVSSGDDDMMRTPRTSYCVTCVSTNQYILRLLSATYLNTAVF